MKYKFKRKNKTFKSWYILVILIIIIILMSTSYSLWQTNLYINGTVVGELNLPELPVEVPSQGTDENGIDRVTVNTSMDFWGTDIYEVTDEEYNGNTITTSIRHLYKQWFGSSNPEVTISFEIQNNTDKNFTNGAIDLIDYNDGNGIFQNLEYTTSNATITPGESSKISISVRLKGNEDVADNTYYNFAITYEIEGVKYYFYYNIILIPR